MREDIIVGEKFMSLVVFSGIVPFTWKEEFTTNGRLVLYSRFIVLVVFAAQFFTVCMVRSFSMASYFVYLISAFSAARYGVTCFLCVALVSLRSAGICRILNRIVACWGGFTTDLKRTCVTAGLTKVLKWNLLVVQCLVVLHPLTHAPVLRGGIAYTSGPWITFFLNHFILCCDYLFVVTTVNIYFLFKCLNRTFVETYKMCSVAPRNSKSPNWHVASLRAFYRDYMRILDIVADVNEYFAPINLVSLTFSLTALTITVVFFVSKITPYGTNDALFRFDLAYFIYFFLNKTVCCFFAVSKIDEEVQNTATVLHQLHAEAASDPHILEELDVLSLLLLHRKVEFDAYGCFKLDFSFLLSMISTITTYTVILIQFESASLTRNVECSQTQNGTQIL